MEWLVYVCLEWWWLWCLACELVGPADEFDDALDVFTGALLAV